MLRKKANGAVKGARLSSALQLETQGVVDRRAFLRNSGLPIGGNPAEAHPVSLQHLLKAKEQGAQFIVCDPRFTRTAAHATEYVRHRPGTDIPFVWGILWHIFENGWEDKKLMEAAGIPLSRWADGVLEAKENIDQPDTIKGMIYWGHAPNSQTRGPDLKRAMEKLDILVVVDPHPTVTAVLHDRTDGVYLLPAATQYETSGSVTASNRPLQWREKAFGPFFEALPDHEIMYLLAKKLGFEKEMFKNIKVEG